MPEVPSGGNRNPGLVSQRNSGVDVWDVCVQQDGVQDRVSRVGRTATVTFHRCLREWEYIKQKQGDLRTTSSLPFPESPRI